MFSYDGILCLNMSKLNDVIILDTAGRLQIDEELMSELQNVKSSVK